eukprot:CAMPEP_0197893088 /NCGR_PEP_ID=MMETSP1439-20131203/32570_1 /TAXON_ID=66791 /ORGANISM="Gonyaulax spinifera, Strain CCMP409" /LENGTH=45 /DNA_ID= /DNA_START= /DNA_END= /DNA_ORIENTATION=
MKCEVQVASRSRAGVSRGQQRCRPFGEFVRRGPARNGHWASSAAA